MSGINSTLPLKTVNFKASNTAVSQPIVKQQQKETTLTEKVFDRPLTKAKYVAGIAGGIGFLVGMGAGFFNKEEKIITKKIIEGLKIGTLGGGLLAIKATVVYLIGSAVVNYFFRKENK
jgi:hypothetical protein